MAKATPIRGLSAGVALHEAGPRILEARLRDVQKHQAGLPGAEAVHDARVAVRRLRAALRLLRLRDLDAPVKKLQDALGEVRDLQLQVEWLTGRDHALAARRKALLDRAKRALARAVGVWRSQTGPRLAEAGAGTFTGKFADRKMRKQLRKRLARFEERLERALARPGPQAMHAVRRSVKQLRYLFELARPALRSVSKSLLAELAPLQEALGELHDVDVRIQLLRDPALLREQREDRERLAKIVSAELARWKKQKSAPHARRALA
jgi:CHAD domain-containing protein